MNSSDRFFIATGGTEELVGLELGVDGMSILAAHLSCASASRVCGVIQDAAEAFCFCLSAQ